MGIGQGAMGNRENIGITKVQEELRGCGIGTMLALLRFIDEDITAGGGFNIQRNIMWEQNVALRTRAQDNCETILFLTNSAGAPNDPSSKVIQSKCYLSAATTAEYSTLFTFRSRGGNAYEGFEHRLCDVISHFTSDSNAKQFVEQYGAFWYFCK